MTRPAVQHRIGVAAVRVGRAPDPVGFVPLAYQTWEGRYDDPDRTWRTLYLARDAYGAWVEVLGRFADIGEPDTLRPLAAPWPRR